MKFNYDTKNTSLTLSQSIDTINLISNNNSLKNTTCKSELEKVMNENEDLKI